jgi:hypothetical protein
MLARSRTLSAFASLAALLFLAGCSTSSTDNPADASTADVTSGDASGLDASGQDAVADATTDAATGAGSDAFAGPHARFPQVPNMGGPRLVSPAPVTVTFQGDARNAEFEAYAQWIVGSTWLATVGGEYGVGAGTVGGAVQLDETPAAMLTSGDIEARLASGIKDGSIPTPASGLGNALYMVYYPATTTSIVATFVDGITAASCTDWIAYHGEAHLQGLDFSYAVMPDCGDTATGLDVNQFIEQAASHEFIEAATDAFPITDPAYQLASSATDPWFSFFRFEVEVGDLCEVPAITYTETGHVAQRIWSNAGAAAGGDPCIPADPSMPYYNTSATPNLVQHVAPGATVQIQLQPWSLAPVANWEVSAQVRTPTTLTPNLSITPSIINNGGAPTLTIGVPANADAGSSAAIYLLSAHSQTDYHMWPVFVVTP